MLIKYSKNFSSKGFTLIELMVVLGLLAAAGVFVGKILFQAQKGQKKVSANFAFTTKMWEVFNVLQNSGYCNSTTNLVFKEKTAAGALVPAKLSNENIPDKNTVNWIGYRVGSDAAAQDIKVLEEGDVIENTITVSNINFLSSRTLRPQLRQMR
ncbi:MAG: type II secretion system protein [Pseudomonadota bacterium]